MGRIKNYAENWLDQMRLKHPTAYAMADKMVNQRLTKTPRLTSRHL